MIPSTLLALLSIASVSQAAATKKILSSDDVIVLKTDGTSQVMKATDLHALETAPAISTSKATSKRGLQRRGCQKSTEVQVLSDKEFLNWDVAMSPVISSLGGSKGTVSVSSGYSIGNSLSVGTSFDVTLIKDILGVGLSVDYSQSWSSDQSQSLSFEVPEGHHGIIVSQPYVRRVEGRVLDGCTDNPDKTEFVSDSYESQSYGNLEWVRGVIRLCSSETYPIPFCNGEGSHK
ncbi:hypothetical protein FSARC_13937 [Fusarium sarcochroum]|uniref:Celp0028 effector like protein n=1 Tax=Fusarium sarcochroum TaxID=1208366 RepID=A0A8H4WRQ1_9HYPO|nr:hypothetical protein FSARC_13937 [Fusarium sarcochroum]